MGYSRSTCRRGAALAVLLGSWLPGFSPYQAVLADQQVVVLRNGNVLEGEVTRQAAHVLVQSGRSQIRFAAADVETVAPNLVTAYRRKAAQIAEHPTSARCQLIRWCVRHGLKQEAAAQIEILEKDHPDHPQLALLRQLAGRHRSEWKATELPVSAPLHPDRAHAAEVRGRLSKNTMTQFVRVVQPLLLNRCGQATCHGTATDTSYRLLSSPWSSVPRGTTERNLGATLRAVGRAPPAETVLWMSAGSPHGPLSRKPLEHAELRALQAWIEQLSAELAGRQTGAAPSDPGLDRLPPASDDAGGSGEVDPFDPAAFNDAASPAPPRDAAPEPGD